MDVVRSLALACCLTIPAAAVNADPFEQVITRAKTLADAPYDDRRDALPPALREIGYDTYRDIRFRADQALWKDNGHFSVQLFHSGFIFDQPVTIHQIENGETRTLEFSRSLFDYDGNAASLPDSDLDGAGFAGFRLHYPLNRADYQDEFLVFLGASYFRMIGRDQGYGLSARGLAIDTASSEGEEFPAFREFWLVEPDENAHRMTIVALLDSPSLTGAYRFEVIPGKDVVLDVEAQLFARDTIDKLGIAPLTSMYAHGDTTPRNADDFRPRVHDSNGLLMNTSRDEWIWRPLINPRELRISHFQDAAPSGFGLVQRPRDFEDYLDLESHYERRPSHWVEPLEGDWGQGHVELVEIPSDSETNDNIVAYWVPDRPLEAGQSRRFHYRLSTFDDRLPQQNLAQAIRTRQGWGAVPGQDDPPPRSVRQFTIDFRGGELSSLDASHPVEARLETSSGEISNLQVQRLPDGETWRAGFRLTPERGEAADMRWSLTYHGEPMTETWNHVWYPDESE
ncbi:glucan biosynthesis protein [Aidingimonas halophila]|uniref:Glucans biosynthesis protein n=1 Tax=Aidingimonas halophila TaxID=574349 RepID=A0A1H3EB91_9GAMM|nr:glucan biosynthesis protein G [Aidingimonas halophila]GHC33759.1 glucan biosynthesis protein D [Aidingimonas halophila]SDX76022.1 glucans biosynthesis protein [Aidingimonas halophila]